MSGADGDAVDVDRWGASPLDHGLDASRSAAATPTQARGVL
jgi:hypothetical protein